MSVNAVFEPSNFRDLLGVPDNAESGIARENGVERSFFLVVEGEAVPQLGGRIVKFGKRAGLKANPRTADYQDIVRKRATVVWNGRPLIADTPIVATATFYREIPKSFSKAKRAAAIAGDLLPITKPDCTNFMKAFEDALSGVVFVDDALIVKETLSKFYSDRPRVEVTLTW